MTLRVAAVVLLGLAAALYGGVARPARATSEATLEERAGLESRAGELRTRLAQLKDQWGISEAPEVSPEAAIAGLRRDVIRALATSDLAGVRLDVGEGRAPVAANVGIQARGTIRVALSFIEDLAVGSGMVLDSVRLSPTRSGAVQLDVKGFRFGGVP